MYLSWTCLLPLLYLLDLTLAVWPQPTKFTNGSQVLWFNQQVAGIYKSPVPLEPGYLSYPYEFIQAVAPCTTH